MVDVLRLALTPRKNTLVSSFKSLVQRPCCEGPLSSRQKHSFIDIEIRIQSVCSNASNQPLVARSAAGRHPLGSQRRQRMVRPLPPPTPVTADRIRTSISRGRRVRAVRANESACNCVRRVTEWQCASKIVIGPRSLRHRGWPQITVVRSCVQPRQFVRIVKQRRLQDCKAATAQANDYCRS